MRAPHGIEGLYVHLPFCDGKCGYCAFYSLSGRDAAMDAYLAALEAELERYGREWPGLAPSTLYIGGGTPTRLSAAQLERLCGGLAGRLDLSRLQEWTVEANPGTLDAARLSVLKAAGVNRISLGVQSLDDATLARLGRRHGAAQAREACASIRAAGFQNWSLDLIACVPGVSARAWAATVREAAALGAPHLSVYALTREEGSRLAGEVAAGRVALVDDEAQLRALRTAERILARAGLARYEISNYARPGHECAHNVACWNGEEYLGLGAAASSFVRPRRWTNAPDLDAYLEATREGRPPPREEESLAAETQAVERMVFGLRMRDGVAPARILADHGLAGDSALARHWRRVLPRLRAEGVARRRGAHWRLTRRGREVADYAAVELMP